jgi:hypothetical protein
MGEFMGRWMLLGGVGVAALAAIGLRAGGVFGWVLAGVWIGFCNAALRPMVLRMPWRGGALLAGLFGVLALLNAVLFAGAQSWVPLSGNASWWAAAVAAGVVTVCSFGASARFRAHDGRWHWITYHACVSKRE